MIPTHLRTAKVIDTVDPDKEGKVKVQVLPEMKDVKSDDLFPWAKPYKVLSGTQENVGKHEIPEIDSIVTVYVKDDKWVDFYYLDGEYISGLYPYSKWDDIKSDMSEIASTNYPQPNFTAYKDGTVIFNNTESGDIGIYHSSGKYIVIDADGKVFIDSEIQVSEKALFKDDVEIEKDLDITGTTTAGGSKTLVTYDALDSALSSFQSSIQIALNAHIHIDPLSGVTGIPAPPIVVSPFVITASKTTKITSA